MSCCTEFVLVLAVLGHSSGYGYANGPDACYETFRSVRGGYKVNKSHARTWLRMAPSYDEAYDQNNSSQYSGFHTACCLKVAHPSFNMMKYGGCANADFCVGGGGCAEDYDGTIECYCKGSLCNGSTKYSSTNMFTFAGALLFSFALSKRLS